jgi:hypothetical protein
MRCVDVLDHVLPYLRVVVEHRHGVSHVPSVVLLLVRIGVHFFLDFVDLPLNVVETPLLRFLHLNHHLLDLFELLETVRLHLLKLFLL